MSFFAFGNRSINSGSTAATSRGPQSNPSTATLLAEVDFNGTNATILPGGQNYGFTWIVSAGTTGVTFLCEVAQSPDLDMAASTTFRAQFAVAASSLGSGQFFSKHTIEPGDRARIRVNSSFTGAASGFISAEPLV
jgi:hypothetical protein